MNFLDNTGHIFSLPSSASKPIGYEYEINDYVFWIKSNTNLLSLNSYYCKVINLLLPLTRIGNKFSINDQYDINISIEHSNVFSLVKASSIHNHLNDNLLVNLDANNNFTNELSSDNDDDIIGYIVKYDDTEDSPYYGIVPIYVVGKASEEATWISNILIHIYDKTTDEHNWCPASIGGEFAGETEQLIINGKNLGINLPKEILKSVYGQSYYNSVFNETLYNEKLKEYLLNYVGIKAKAGSFESAINSLKWFGYGDHITISKLLKLNNNVQTQYFNDFFDIKTDFIRTFDKFKTTSFVSLKLDANAETGQDNININKGFLWGEGMPQMSSLFKAQTKVKVGYDNGQFEYIDQYYKFTLDEMLLKLSCLKYFYEKYFLPVHLKIHSITVQTKTYMNNIKLTTAAKTNLSEDFLTFADNDTTVVFDDTSTLMLTKQLHYVDENYNEFIISDNIDKTYYEVNDLCCNVKIKFSGSKFYDCVLLLETYDEETENNKEYVLKNKFNIFTDELCVSTSKNAAVDLESLIYKYGIKENSKIVYSNSINSYSDLKNKITNSITISGELVKIKIKDEYDITIANHTAVKINDDNTMTLKHNDVINENALIYDDNDNTSITIKIDSDNKILEYNGNKYLTFTKEQQYLSATIDDDTHVTLLLPSINDVQINPINNIDFSATLSYVEEYYLKLISPDYNLNITLSKNSYGDISEKEVYENNFTLKTVNNNYSVIYESKFSFTSTEYSCFVLYPKMLNSLGIYDYWINRKFKIQLLCNGRWYEHEFKLSLPEFTIKMGKLEYKYYNTQYSDLLNGLNDITENDVITYTLGEEQNIAHGNNIVNGPSNILLNNLTSNFSQIYSIGDDDNIKFNTFMWEPSLVTVNNRNFFKDLIAYCLKMNIRYISKATITDTLDAEFLLFEESGHLEFTNYDKVYIHKNLIDKIDKSTIEKIISNSNNKTTYIFKYNKIICIISEVAQDIMFISLDGKYATTEASKDEIDNLSFTFPTYYDSGMSSFIKKYEEYINLSTSKEYKNKIHIFDIYKKTINGLSKQIFRIHNNYELISGGVKFSFITTNKNKVLLNGTIKPSSEIDTRVLDVYSIYGNNLYVDQYGEKHLPIQKCNIGYFYYVRDEFKDRVHETVDGKEVYYVTNEKYSMNTETFNSILTIDFDNVKDCKEFIFDRGSVNVINKDILRIFMPKIDFMTDDEYHDNIQSVLFDTKANLDNIHTIDFGASTAINANDRDIHVIKKIHNEGNGIEFTFDYKIVSSNNTNITIDQFDELYNTDDQVDDLTIQLSVNCVIHYLTENEYTRFPRTDVHQKMLDTPVFEDDDMNVVEFKEKLNANESTYIFKNDTVLNADINDVRKYYDLHNDLEVSTIQPGIWYWNPSMLPHRENTSKRQNFYLLSINGDSVTNGIANRSVYDFSDKALNNPETYDNYIYNNLLIFDLADYISKINDRDEFTFQYSINQTDLDNESISINSMVVYKDGTSKEGIKERVTFNKSKIKNAYIYLTLSNSTEEKLQLNNTEVEINIDMLYDEYVQLKFEGELEDEKNNNYNILTNKYKCNVKADPNQNILYNVFFRKTLSITKEGNDTVNFYDSKINIDDHNFSYDFYLMHDNDYWYGVYISKTPYPKYTTTETYKFDNLTLPDGDDTIYKLTYRKSGEQFLLNRMKYVDDNGVHQFNKDDIIVARLSTDVFGTNINHSTKWEINPMSMYMNTKNNILKSNTEMTIISNSYNKEYHERGYYDITVRYSIDGNSNQQKFNKAKFVIKD